MLQPFDKKDHLASVVSDSDDAIFTKSLDGIVLTWNASARRIFGYTDEEMIGETITKIFPPELIADESMILEKIAQGERMEHFKTRRKRKDGRMIDISVTFSPIYDQSGKVSAVSTIARDISEQMQAERLIAQYKALIDSSDDAIISKDTRGIILTWNASATRIFGYSQEEAVGQHISLLFPKERLHEEEKLLRTVLAGEPIRHFRTTRLTKDGKRIFTSVSLSSIKDGQGAIIGFSKIVRDLTQEIKQEQLLWHEVHFDSLTGMMSRLGLQNAVDDLIRVSQIRHRAIAVVCCNIDGFSRINAQFGIEVGDRLLIRLAQALKQTVREADDIARTHADNFVVVLQGFTQFDSIPKALEKIKAAMESIDRVGDQAIDLSVSMGVAVYPEDGKTYARLINRAEHALQTSRLKGRSAVQFSSNLDRADVPEDFFIVQGLNGAIEAGQIHLEYQPIIDTTTGKIVKAEALVRWVHPDFGNVSPAVFIPLAEKYGIIRKISQWVLRQALQDLARWTNSLGMAFQVSVNRSSHDFVDYDESHNEMRNMLHEFGLCGENVIIEVTEHSLMSSACVTEKILRAYRSLGVSVALDDFGTGYSSLDYLKRYPVDFLKIDRSFVETLEYNSVQFQLCDGIISIAKRLGLQVVAEGVETELQAEILRHMGTEFIQGYFYGKPMRADDLEALVAGTHR